jgi:hypothetical protein
MLLTPFGVVTYRISTELESIAAADDKETLNGVVEAFGRYRLLTFDRDPVTGESTVEVAHEALIRNWDHLQEWLEASRGDLRTQRQLMSAQGEWAMSGRDASFLASGARLTQFEALAAGASRPGGVALTSEEREYLAASVEERDRQERAERERQSRELDLQKRAASRLRYLVAGLALFLAVAIILSGFAVNRSQAADDNAKQAQLADSCGPRRYISFACNGRVPG